MANQCQQLLRLLQAEGLQVSLVRTNEPNRPTWVGRVPVLRAVARLVPYVLNLWRTVGRSDVVHVLANSGWAWHLFAAPALWVARRRGVPAIVNYRGGEAARFFAAAPPQVMRAMAAASMRVTPSDFLRRVFSDHNLRASVIPNILDLDRFEPQPLRDFGNAPRVLVARNLEPIYGLPTALRAFQAVRARFKGAVLVVAGTGPQRHELESLAQDLGLIDAVEFPGRIEHADMPRVYANSDLALNPSTVDNMPNSVLEAYASGVPVVSTDAGGVPDICQHGQEGLLVPVGDAAAMGAAMLRLLEDAALRQHVRQHALARAQAWGWPRVKQQWLDAYAQVMAGREQA